LDSVATKLLASFVGVEGKSWLRLSLGPTVAELSKNSGNLEADDARLPAGQDIEANRRHLNTLTRDFFDRILRLGDTCPEYLFP